MKKTMLAVILLASATSFADGGIVCTDVSSGKLQVWTNEAADAAADNLVSIGATFGDKEPMSFTKVASDSVSYENKILMGSNDKGESITLELNTSTEEDIKLSTVYLKTSEKLIIKETKMLCK